MTGIRSTETRALRAIKAHAARRLADLEGAMHILGMTSAARTPGRKPAGYEPLTSVDDVVRKIMSGDGN